MKLNSTTVATASLLLCGCLTSVVPNTQSDSSSTGMTEPHGTGVSDPSRGSSGSPSSATSATETTSGSTLDTSSGSGAVDWSSSSSGSGLPACLDEGTRRTAMVELGPNLWDTQQWENVDAMCFVGGFERGGDISEYALECDEGGAEPTVRSLFAPFISALDVGMTVRLRYLRQYVLDGGSYWAFAIHDLEGALVMGNYRNRLPDGAPIDPATFFAPLEFDSVDGLCGPARPENDSGGLLADPCPFIRTPLGVSVVSGDRATTVVDGTARSVAGYEFNVTAYFADYVDPELCGGASESISVHVFSEQGEGPPRRRGRLNELNEMVSGADDCRRTAAEEPRVRG